MGIPSIQYEMYFLIINFVDVNIISMISDTIVFTIYYSNTTVCIYI